MKSFLKEYRKILDLFNGLGVCGLGTTTPKFVGWTVSLPDRHKVSVFTTMGGRKYKKVQLEWRFLTPAQQINYFIDTYLKSVVAPYVQKSIVVFEQNKSGMIHMHMLCYDAGIQNDYSLTSLRANVRQEGICLSMAGSNMEKHKHLNFIHWVENVPEWIQYMQKDIELHDYPVLLIE